MGDSRIRRVSGTALPLRGDNIDTDRIIPARFLKAITFEGLEAHLFEDDRQQADARTPNGHPLSNPAYADATILLVDANFGCGSSREHAPQAIRRRGIRAIVGQSFSEIFFGNSVAMGLPCVTVPRAAADELMAIAVERWRKGRSGLYDVSVTRGQGEVVAEVRGRSRTISGSVIPPQ